MALSVGGECQYAVRSQQAEPTPKKTGGGVRTLEPGKRGRVLPHKKKKTVWYRKR